MRRVFRPLIMLLLLMSLTSITGAVDIPVSITMPAIPGVNVPLIEEETKTNQEPADSNTKQDTSAVVQANQDRIMAQKQQPTLSLIQQDSELTTLNEQPLVTVRTLYER